MILLEGRPVREQIAKKLITQINRFKIKPVLAIIQVGDDSRSTAYIKQKKIFGEKIGAEVRVINFPVLVKQAEVVAKIINLNSDASVNGIIVQIPLPENLNKQEIINAIDPAKDVDGLTIKNQGALLVGVPKIIPATARGIVELLEFYGIDISGKTAVVMGRSILVGSPVAKLLALKGAKVSVVHSQTENPKILTKEADILVVAVGQAGLVGPSYIKEGVVVVDVGINSVPGEQLVEEAANQKIAGDTDFSSLKGIASAISPVPGGVGPMTVSALFENLLDAYRVQSKNLSV